ncbi:hypothetical protein NIES593_06355 [Hydrococcus rivularis NIES-593]|uniref:Uncharacterized protein n=1 Tax=Hydrococcus rivularis NIES-593 TaxID=1921803 RepID=A0A1U7HMT9_9CYAN|nr:hypothetical protein [Hydrococcus rivularis]OKH24835.1 hypothetical protein NIES593_06355 [Hydrococcus rivularis NIES-593]
MKRWEFLIQQEGDRAWLSVKEPTLELEEGRYRIVARANRANLDVEIRIAHQIEENGRIVQHCDKYSRRTNSEGLVTILPLTDLTPGCWEIRCRGDIMSELLGEFWQESMQLKIVSKPLASNWEPQFLPHPSTPSPNPYLQQLEQLLRNEIEPMLEEGASSSDETDEKAVLSFKSPSFVCLEEEKSAEAIAPLSPEDGDIETKGFAQEETIDSVKIADFLWLSFAKIAAQELQIVLEQDTVVRGKGEAIAISGRIEALNPNLSKNLESVLLGKLLYELRNPETGEICIALVQSLPETTLPHAFNCCLEIPSDWDVPLAIGTVILETAAGFASIREPFIVITEAQQAPAKVQRPTNYAIALPDSAEELSRTINYLLAEEAKTPPLNLDLPEPSKMTKKLEPSKSPSGQILPPKLVFSDAIEEIKLPQLPPLPNPQPTPSPEAIDDTPVESGQLDFSERKMLEKADSVALSQPTLSVEEAFQSLHLEERFLLRLNSIAEQAQETEANVSSE